MTLFIYYIDKYLLYILFTTSTTFETCVCCGFELSLHRAVQMRRNIYTYSRPRDYYRRIKIEHLHFNRYASQSLRTVTTAVQIRCRKVNLYETIKLAKYMLKYERNQYIYNLKCFAGFDTRCVSSGKLKLLIHTTVRTLCRHPPNPEVMWWTRSSHYPPPKKNVMTS